MGGVEEEDAEATLSFNGTNEQGAKRGGKNAWILICILQIGNEKNPIRNNRVSRRRWIRTWLKMCTKFHFPITSNLKNISDSMILVMGILEIANDF